VIYKIILKGGFRGNLETPLNPLLQPAEVYDSDNEQKWSVVHGRACTPVLFPANVAAPSKPIPTSL